jgi:hypothetical protein
MKAVNEQGVSSDRKWESWLSIRNSDLYTQENKQSLWHQRIVANIHNPLNEIRCRM